MFVAYGSIAAVGYWYFGDALQPIVVTNMVKGSVYTGRTLLAGLDVGLLTGVLVGFRAYTVLPAVLVVLQVRSKGLLTTCLVAGTSQIIYQCAGNCSDCWPSSRRGLLCSAACSSVGHQDWFVCHTLIAVLCGMFGKVLIRLLKGLYQWHVHCGSLLTGL